MRNIKLTLEYDGTRYNGWQRLGKGESTNTIENKIIEVLKKMDGQDVELFCGCRTEVGVHAYAQVVSFKTNSALEIKDIKNYLNRYLPMDIAVLEAEEMPERFHASLNAKEVTYVYRIAIGDVPSVFDRRYTYYSFKTPDIKRMKSAAKALIGEHDFRYYSTVKKNKSTVKEMREIDIYQDAREIQITMKADSFLHNMARMIAGTLLDIGLGKRDVSVTREIFDAHSDEMASAPAEAKGLFLQEIGYSRQ